MDGMVTGSGADQLRQLVREVLAEALPALARRSGQDAGELTVRLGTDEELHAFVLRVLRLGENPKLRADLIAGRIRFSLAGQPAGAAGLAEHRIEKGAVTERVVVAAARASARLVLGRGAVLTPLGRDRARALGVAIEKER